jgi:hypothetical protein
MRVRVQHRYTHFKYDNMICHRDQVVREQGNNIFLIKEKETCYIFRQLFSKD